ncbi:response regulator [Pseudoalteromonas arctica]|uniref:HD domain-containing phosphohydrolase n=1 Tax=Pseudoalteromonas arctica TaxID=394751 RepID=UPI00145C1E90|nr:HD domain-containing phosphohydrolase [Pseudoalteromonas arctica]NMP80776.1 response regulator [Pseudoalteromonas arctica]
MKDSPLILVVDDNLQNIELMQAYLEPKGYNTVTATGGQQALDILAQQPVDLILLDIMMPGMNGFEVTRRVREDALLKLLPIVLITALRETKERVKGIDAGCDDFITKPVDKNELLSRVKSLLKIKDYNDLRTNYQKQLEAEVAQRTESLKLAMQSIKAASLETINRLTKAAEYKDEETGAHIQRMSLYSEAVARSVGLDEGTVENILFSASMHDLGKISTPDHILLKAGQLDATEWEIMKQHTVVGASILSGSDSEVIKLGEIIARSHHEKWDGSGYPDGLKGNEIPIAARVVAIADVFDALSSKRPYKKSFSQEKTFAIIKEGSGKHFDPAVVDAFFAVQEEILAIKQKYAEK